MNRFNPRKYLGKDRVYTKISKATDISRLYVWDSEKKSYRDPKNGKKYLARRTELDRSGEAKRRTKYFSTFEMAKVWQEASLKSREVETSDLCKATEVHSRATESYTLLDLVEDFKKHRFPLLREGTRIAYQKRFPLFQPLMSSEVEQISPRSIDRWLEWLKNPEQLKGYKKLRISFEKELEILKTLLNWHLGRSYETRLKLPFLKKHYEEMYLKKPQGKKQRFMTAEEVEKWFDALEKVSPFFHAAAIVQVHQLMRMSEVFAMKWSNCDLENRSYRVSEYVYYPRKKAKAPEICQGGKTMEAGEFYVSPLRERVVRILSDLERKNDCDLIFHNKGELWTYRQVQYWYDEAFKEAGLPYRSSHVCRHTGATMFYEETGDLLAVQQMGNWSTSRTAQNYAKLLNDRAKRAVEKADRKRNLRLVEGAS